MPTYDYVCEDCGVRFDVRMSISAYSEGPKPTCPDCGSARVARSFTAVNVMSTGRGSGSSSRGPSCGPSRFT